MVPTEFGEVDFENGTSVLFYGGYVISPATSSTAAETKKLRIRFYARDQPKLTAILDRTYAVRADGTEVLRLYSRDPLMIEIQVKNRNGTIAFRQAFGIVDGKPAEINSPRARNKMPEIRCK